MTARLCWICLTAGLAMVWVCHAPVGIWATMFTAVVQGLRLLTRDFNSAAWERALLAGGLLAGLDGYYFWSIAEIAPKAAKGDPHFLPIFLLLAWGLAAFIRFLATARVRWLLMAIAAAGLLWFLQRGEQRRGWGERWRWRSD